MATAKKTPAKATKPADKKAAPAKTVKSAAKPVAAKKVGAPAKKAAAPAKKAAVPAKKAAVPAKKAAPAKKVAAKRTPSAAFMKALTPSPALAAVIGAGALPRTAVVSKLWDYIKKNKLQDQTNKRNINADDKLKAVFGKQQVSMFELASLIGKHLS